MAQHHLPSLATLGTGPAAAPTEKFLGVGRSKGQTMKELLREQEALVRRAWLFSRKVVLDAAEKADKYDSNTRKYSDEDREEIQKTFMDACKRSEVLRQMLMELEVDLGLEVTKAQDLCKGDDSYDAMRKAAEEMENPPMGQEVVPVYQGQIVPQPQPVVPVVPSEPVYLARNPYPPPYRSGY